MKPFLHWAAAVRCIQNCNCSLSVLLSVCELLTVSGRWRRDHPTNHPHIQLSERLEQTFTRLACTSIHSYIFVHHESRWNCRRAGGLGRLISSAASCHVCSKYTQCCWDWVCRDGTEVRSSTSFIPACHIFYQLIFWFY
jgi:hypothetical protein